MSEILTAFIAGGSMSAIVSGVFSIIMYKAKRKDAQACENDIVQKALRYIMLYIIQDRIEQYIKRGEVTVDERRSIHRWHDLNHNGLNGNGDADSLMEEFDKLPTKFE